MPAQKRVRFANLPPSYLYWLSKTQASHRTWRARWSLVACLLWKSLCARMPHWTLSLKWPRSRAALSARAPCSPPEDVTAAVAAGARFGVSPGATETFCLMPAKPRTSRCSPALRRRPKPCALLERGYTVQKFFPAEASGGAAAALKAIGSPIPQVRFCPTGGVSPKNAR